MYTYGDLLDDVSRLSRMGVETGAIGSSVYGRLIPYVHLKGEGRPVLVTAGIHAREHVTSLFAIKQIYALIKAGHRCDFYSVPMLNPDGNVLIANGAGAFGYAGKELIKINGGEDFSLWKANGAGVDLNVNFNARWSTGKCNVFKPSPCGYVGKSPLSEPESVAAAEFTLKIRPCITLSYHAAGGEIYYYFYQSGALLKRDRDIAEYASRLTGFTLINDTRGSAGGYKDWCVQRLNIPALTLELVKNGSHPLQDGSIDGDFLKEPALPEKLYIYIKEKGYV